jgi:hypothetical protein
MKPYFSKSVKAFYGLKKENSLFGNIILLSGNIFLFCFVEDARFCFRPIQITADVSVVKLKTGKQSAEVPAAYRLCIFCIRKILLQAMLREPVFP